jgi:hypothetical protein
MKKIILFVFLGSVTPIAIAAGPASGTYIPAPRDVLSELSRRSAVPEAELKDLLSDCNAGQQNMYFCAYRDLVASDLVLKHAVVAKQQQLPACKAAIEAKISRWKRDRDRVCENAAFREWGEGSMKPTAQALCAVDETNRMVKRVQGIRSCSNH